MKEHTRTLISITYFIGGNNILMGIYQKLLSQLRFDIYSALNENTTYFYMF